jgi:hypothetical protein
MSQLDVPEFMALAISTFNSLAKSIFGFALSLLSFQNMVRPYVWFGLCLLAERRDLRIDGGDVRITGLHRREQNVQVPGQLATLKQDFRVKTLNALARFRRSGDVVGGIADAGYCAFYTHCNFPLFAPAIIAVSR